MSTRGRELKELVEVGAAAVMLNRATKSTHGMRFVRHMIRGSLAALVATICSGVSILAFKQASTASRAHREWMRQDRNLDQALRDSLDASDAIAKY